MTNPSLGDLEGYVGDDQRLYVWCDRCRLWHKHNLGRPGAPTAQLQPGETVKTPALCILPYSSYTSYYVSVRKAEDIQEWRAQHDYKDAPAS